MKLGNKTIGQDFLIIAEAGSTTRGNPDIAKQLASHAKDAGVDAIKYILTDASELCSEYIDYEGESLEEIVRSYQMDSNAWVDVIQHCKEIELPYFFSVGTPNYIPLAESLGNPIYKVSAWDTMNTYLISDIIKTGKPLMFDISCVLSGEVQQILDYIADESGLPILDLFEHIAFVYESHSPNIDELNLNSIPWLIDKYSLPVGFSADWRDSNPDLWSVRNGSCLVEKRICLDGTPGHHVNKSLSPAEMKHYVDMIHKKKRLAWSMTEESQACGVVGLRPSITDITNRAKYFVSLVADKDIKQGDIITKDMLAARRPGGGISPIFDYQFIGRPAAKDFRENETLGYDTIA